MSPSVADDVSYPYRPSSADVPRQPHKIFELFVDVAVIDLLCKHTTTYAVQKGITYLPWMATKCGYSLAYC